MTEARTNDLTSGDHALGSMPDELSSPRAKLVYLALRTAPGLTVGELRASLEMPTLALYPTLELLIDRGLAERDGETYVPADDR